MSVYGFDADRDLVVAVWPVGIGSQACVVVQLTAAIAKDQAQALSAALTRLSETMWDTYVRPASSAVDEEESRRRGHERAQLDAVASALRQPSVPDDAGMLEVSYSPVEEAAHRLGRLLRHFGDPALTDVVVAEAQTEVDAVTQAELGNLSGRAIQAVAMNRIDASPVQVTAADAILQTDPLSPELLSAAVDPAAACVAAAHWLAAAAAVAAQQADTTPAGVFAEADDIQTTSIEIPALIAEQICDDEISPRDLVLTMLRTAAAAGEGIIADLPAVVAEQALLLERLEPLPDDQRAQVMAAQPPRSTLLNPRRPARDLLEHLLDGINSCHILYAEYALDAEYGLETDLPDDPDVTAETTDTGENDFTDREAEQRWSAEEDERQRRQIAVQFVQLVRLEAASTHDRLD